MESVAWKCLPLLSSAVSAFLRVLLLETAHLLLAQEHGYRLQSILQMLK